MPNMSYCRFSNTLSDLRDCEKHMEDQGLSDAEQQARDKLIALCQRIANDWAEDDEEYLPPTTD